MNSNELIDALVNARIKFPTHKEQAHCANTEILIQQGSLQFDILDAKYIEKEKAIIIFIKAS